MSTTSSTSRALFLEEFGILPRLGERPVPEPRPGHTLVRVAAATAAHLDLNILDGQFGILPELPFIPGTQGSGYVVASDTHPEGALVRLRGEGLGLSRDGAWAEYALVPDTAAEVMPEGTDPALACIYFSPVGTAWATVHAIAQVKPGERVLVTGASGAVGAVAVQLAARAGAEVIGAVGRPAKLPHVPDAAKALLASDLSEEAIGGKVDVLIDTVGGQILRDALTLVRPRGRAALLGYTAGRELTLDLADFFLADVTLLPVNMMSRGPEVASEVLSLLPDLSSGALTLPYERYGMDALGEAVERLRSGAAVGKIVLDMEHTGN
ncbi:zinc-binding alcohol dehydrogenase family protein [Streptomyces sp. VRA16 Mangrove soil]|uniref:quinone oxidoreductase family protein n=1 Tax=Streptomyces sp. VRA16 Mangrove soil TaxID=2817434 RepID=UPI001A9EEA41|nr:zinc-binding alcohol dehydrogenase family protein [Streptomyces sp. VRA16 Mangrove soil]MBO1330493.1 zinc-binding alcohol dehydrogenase family protein [Streptomyces sp. VRA16 Mangrove soil]